MNRLGYIAFFISLGFLPGAKGKDKPPAEKTIEKKSFDEILASYLFVNDFNVKEEVRNNSEELFWRYPIKLPKPDFPIDFIPKDLHRELPPTPGEGRAYEHLNLGRLHYLAGRYEDAKKVWLTARQNYGKNYIHHRRNDYFIALAFLALAKEKLETEKDGYAATAVKTNLANASTFLSWALILKKDNADPLLDIVASKQFYNLASIYFRYGRYSTAFGAADSGLNFLRQVGKTDFRSELRRFIAESHILNFSYLEAIKEIDIGLRQDPDPKTAGKWFARVGDIYFGLNNFELAEEAYAIANRIDQQQGQISPAQFVLRGEALFWLGKFSEAQKSFAFALSSSGNSKIFEPLDEHLTAIAHLRIADAYLALKDYERAKLEYFKVNQEFRGRPEAGISNVRRACLELPQYRGNNVKHARDLLEKSKENNNLPPEGIELVWACQVASFSQRERTESMVEKVQEFAGKYPNSRFLQEMINPVKEVRAAKLAEYFNKGQTYNAIAYFENRRSILFQKLDDPLRKKLFRAYVDIMRSDKAAEFYNKENRKTYSDQDLLREAAFLTEISAAGKNKQKWTAKNLELARELNSHRWTIEPTKEAVEFLNRVRFHKAADVHRGWILELTKKWGENNSKITCNLLYPMLSRGSKSSSPTETENIGKDVESIIARLFPKLLETDETCAVSMLELEVALLKQQPQQLAARFLSRREWPLNRPLTSLFWEVAEINANQSNLEAARELWTLIKEKAPKESPEQNFAKIRLDASKTVYDGLW